MKTIAAIVGSIIVIYGLLFSPIHTTVPIKKTTSFDLTPTIRVDIVDSVVYARF